jgi:hypothetical protein
MQPHSKILNPINNTILEGELLQIKNCYLFMIYDCLYYDNKDIKLLPSFEDRINYVKKFTDELKIKYFFIDKYNKDDNLTEQEKYYTNNIKFYYNKLEDNIKLLNHNDILFYPKLFLFPTGGNNSEVFLYSYILWNLCTSDLINCPYFIDGILDKVRNERKDMQNE